MENRLVRVLGELGCTDGGLRGMDDPRDLGCTDGVHSGAVDGAFVK
jgi:hypothetical protein